MLWALNSPIPIYVADEREHRGSAASRQFGRSILPGAMPQSLLLSLLWRSSIHIATLRLRSMRRSEIAPLEERLCCAVVANDIPSLSEVWSGDAFYCAGYRRSRCFSISSFNTLLWAVLSPINGQPRPSVCGPIAACDAESRMPLIASVTAAGADSLLRI